MRDVLKRIKKKKNIFLFFLVILFTIFKCFWSKLGPKLGPGGFEDVPNLAATLLRGARPSPGCTPDQCRSSSQDNLSFWNVMQYTRKKAFPALIGSVFFLLIKYFVVFYVKT